MPNKTLECHSPLLLSLTSHYRDHYSISLVICQEPYTEFNNCGFISLYMLILTQNTSWSIFEAHKTSLKTNTSFKEKISHKILFFHLWADFLQNAGPSTSHNPPQPVTRIVLLTLLHWVLEMHPVTVLSTSVQPNRSQLWEKSIS
jgi:hypothetical protein